MVPPGPSPRSLVSRWRSFALRYGWRAYALPILTVVTVAALVRGLPATATPHRHVAAAPPTGHHTTVEGKNAGTTFTRGSAPEPVVISLTAEEDTCAANPYARRVIVSIHKQHLWACDGHRQVLQTPVTTGASTHHDQTPVGSWRVQGRQRNRYLVGPGYRDYVHYWVPFNGDFGLHDAPWEKTGYGSQDYPTKGSHGCVHVPETDMKWLYRWTKVDRTVVTVEA
ncbi:L,D-transpeptidase [Jatrophihabitans endophyticus]|uniref:L,D-transpeptidase n=1 Tax=Jatrophihabitans endophyticus TaxID=1206085 RepID=UPI001A1063FD|nr:L,D-transpeptidase [Jatrophihabitans endophyticus]MBE7189796.1 L,D-transpeptidase [Jatrophihabitans endophyticus]